MCLNSNLKKIMWLYPYHLSFYCSSVSTRRFTVAGSGFLAGWYWWSLSFCGNVQNIPAQWMLVGVKFLVQLLCIWWRIIVFSNWPSPVGCREQPIVLAIDCDVWRNPWDPCGQWLNKMLARPGSRGLTRRQKMSSWGILSSMIWWLHLHSFQFAGFLPVCSEAPPNIKHLLYSSPLEFRNGIFVYNSWVKYAYLCSIWERMTSSWGSFNTTSPTTSCLPSPLIISLTVFM